MNAKQPPYGSRFGFSPAWQNCHFNLVLLLCMAIVSFGCAQLHAQQPSGEAEPKAKLSEAEQKALEEKVKAVYAKAGAAADAGDHRTAKRFYREVTELDPKHYDAWYNLGRMEYFDPVEGVASYRKGIEHINKAVEVYDGVPENLIFFRGQLHEAIGDSTNDRKEILIAIDDYTTAFNLRRRQPHMLLTRALAYHSIGNLDASHRDNKTIIDSLEREEDHPDKLDDSLRQTYNFALLNNVNTLIAARRYDEAVEWGEKAAKFGRGIPNAHRNKGSAYFHRAENYSRDPADYKKAVEGYTETIHLMPRWSFPWHDRGVALSKLHRYHEAEANIMVAARLGGLSQRSLNVLVDCWEALGNYDSQLQAQQALDRIDPANAQITWDHGRLQLKMGLLAEAEQTLMKALQQDPNLSGASLELGQLYLVQGDTEEFHLQMAHTLSNIKQAFDDESEIERGYPSLARIQQTRGLPDEALEIREKFLEVFPNNPYLLHEAAWVYATHPSEESRDLDKARAYITKAIELIKTPNPAMLDTMAAVEAGSGNFQEAIRWQDKAMVHAPNYVRHRHLMRRSLYQREVAYGDPPGPKRPRWLPISVPKEIIDVNDLAAVVPSKESKTLTPDEVAEAYREATVIVQSPYGADINGEERFGYSSGMILDPSGYVLTHCYPIPYEGNVKVIYYLPGKEARETRQRTATAEVVTLDRFSGLALIKFQPQADVAHVQLGFDVEVDAGESVTAIGTMVSTTATGHEAPESTTQRTAVDSPSHYLNYRNLISTAQAFEAGLIGAPLFNKQGQVIGVISKAGTPESGYAVPMAEVARFLGIGAVEADATE